MLPDSSMYKTSVKSLARSKQYILWLDEITKSNAFFSGGKCANLGLVFKKFPIPKGFCITAGAYRDYIEKNDFTGKISRLLENIDSNPKKIKYNVSSKIRSIIEKGEIDPVMRKTILEGYKTLDSKLVAIRSSATAEDLPFASFAGQQDTFLNISSSKALLSYIKKCWASLFTERAISYRIANRISHEKTYMAILVQEMVDARFAGVMFTKDPLDKKYILIEIIKGLGENLVSGRVTPNTYFLDKDKIIKKYLHFKFDESILPNIANIGIELEKLFKHPQDIEFAIDKNNKIFLLQSRNITT